ncbi:hypothetical protein V5O48_009467 [Marasmius crinis-equi]|uniref:F-box domain-containing protein n=1 Tax=Marasmius crinis-equi TaxID=585013 RepID=A0ABR3FBE9_9AGAR
MEDEQPGRWEVFHRDSLYVRVQEKEEADFVKNQYRYLPKVLKGKLLERPAEVTLDADESQSGLDDVDAYRLFHVRRFFLSLEGFYEGKLDLTGRHKQRFEDLSSRYGRFKQDMKTLRETVESEEYQEQNRRGRMCTFTRYIMKDEGLWQDFRLRWKLPRLVDFGTLEDHSNDLERVIKRAKRTPKFQKLCIKDLPQELIDHIFSLAKLSEARRLASACKLMKEIGASYLYHTRSVTLNLAKHDDLLSMIRNQDSMEALDQLASDRSSELIRLVGFLVSRPDLTDAVQNLTIIDGWRMWARELRPVRPYMYDKIFYGPISSSLHILLASCKGLINLTIRHFAITSDWLRAISQMPQLHTLEFHFACINEDIPIAPQVLNLRWDEARYDERELSMRETTGRGIWYTLLLFPNLITFNHNLSRTYASWLPAQDVVNGSDHFCRGLRRLSLAVVWACVPALTTWIQSSLLRTGASCTLTHFKLRTDRSAPDEYIIPLLESLQSAPLEVLVLDGIREGSLELIRRIVQLFPDLIGLTLIRRENRSQRESKLASWPYQSWEYALELRGFRQLRYFGWNYRVPVLDVTPYALLGFEAAVEGCTDETLYEIHGDDEEYFLDESSIALPLASRCPTLELVGLEERLPRHIKISRGPNGEVKTSDERYNVLQNMQDWNPHEFEFGWKPVVPRSEDAIA